MTQDKLFIAIDETGDFSQAKLKQHSGRASGVAAVMTTWTKKALEHSLREIAGRHGLSFPEQFHRMEIQSEDKRRLLQLEFSQDEANAIVKAIKLELEDKLEACVGVYGAPRGRQYFHEQEAYGEALMALVEFIYDRHKEAIDAAPAVELIVATRNQDKLLGYTPADEYATKLINCLRIACKQAGWPASLTIRTAVAKNDAHLMLADFFASDAVGASWAKNLEETTSSNIRLLASGLLARATPASEILLELVDGREPPARALADLKGQTRHSTVSQLVALAHSHVRDRGGRGSMDLAQRIVDYLWSALDHEASPQLAGELCAIAAEICAHTGLSEASPTVQLWRERTNSLGASGWGRNAFERDSNRLSHRIQAAQTQSFNVFDFESAYLGCVDELEGYIDQAGGPDELENDELYGKLLGTLGQACGFMRAQDAALGAQAWDYLVKSGPCFQKSEPLFQAMNVGFRLTDLWDRGELMACDELLTSSNMPRARVADPYTLLHRLRLASAQHHSGQEVAGAAMVKRLLALLDEDPTSAGKTPFDLCLKWALYLEPDSGALRRAATKWIAGLRGDQIALIATSLPLLVQLGDYGPAQNNLSLLKELPDFASHWATQRAVPLANCLAQKEPPAYEALRAMPWNYA